MKSLVFIFTLLPCSHLIGNGLQARAADKDTSLVIRNNCVPSRLESLWTLLTVDIKDLRPLSDPAILRAKVIPAPKAPPVKPTQDIPVVKLESLDAKMLAEATDGLKEPPYVEIRTNQGNTFTGRLESVDPLEIVASGRGKTFYALRIDPSEVGSIDLYRKRPPPPYAVEKIYTWELSKGSYPIRAIRDRSPIEMKTPSIQGTPYREAPARTLEPGVVTVDIGPTTLTGEWASFQPPILKVPLKNGKYQWVELDPDLIIATSPGWVPHPHYVGIQPGETFSLAKRESSKPSAKEVARGTFIKFDAEGTLTFRKTNGELVQWKANHFRGENALFIVRDIEPREAVWATFDPPEPLPALGWGHRVQGSEVARGEVPASPSSQGPYRSVDLHMDPRTRTLTVNGYWRTTAEWGAPGLKLTLAVPPPEAAAILKDILDRMELQGWHGNFKLQSNLKTGTSQIEFSFGRDQKKIRENFEAVIQDLKSKYPVLR